MPCSDIETRDAFLSLLCQDDELVRAEFDAIIAAAWSTEPPPPPPVPAPPGPDDRPTGWPIGSGWPERPGRTARLPVPPRRLRGRQRSPPMRK
jgi:hypothetical protein